MLIGDKPLVIKGGRSELHEQQGAGEAEQEQGREQEQEQEQEQEL